MSSLPCHGRIDCSLCYEGRSVAFDKTQRESDGWRISANPLAWGGTRPEVVVLGFSKGPTQAGHLSGTPHDEIAYKGGRVAVGKILAHVGLIPGGDNTYLKNCVDNLIADKRGKFHFGSLIRCTVERYDHRSEQWKGSGGGMLDKFVATSFGKSVAGQCSKRFLADLPDEVRAVVMFGLGTKGNYVKEARNLIEGARPGNWQMVNEVAYTDGKVTFIHVEHFASQGALLPNWLGENQHERSRLGALAREAVKDILG